MSGPGQAQQFYRYWVAKEAVLKGQAVGLRSLQQCEILTSDDFPEGKGQVVGRSSLAAWMDGPLARLWIWMGRERCRLTAATGLSALRRAHKRRTRPRSGVSPPASSCSQLTEKLLDQGLALQFQ